MAINPSFIEGDLYINEESFIHQRQSENLQPNYIYTGNESPITSGQQLISSASQKDISSGVLILQSVLKTQPKLCLQSINDETIDKLISLISNSDIDFQLQNQILEFMADLSKADKRITHMFWNKDFQQILIGILSEENPSVLLTAPIIILSEMANWTKLSFDILFENHFFDILSSKLSRPLSIFDQFGVLHGIYSIVNTKWPKPENFYNTIITSICSYIMSNELTDQILGEAFKIISSALGSSKTDETDESPQSDRLLNDFDFAPICSYAISELQKRKRSDTRVQLVRFICDAIYRNDCLANIFLDLHIIDVFHELLKLPSEEFVINALSAVRNCLIASPQTLSYLDDSDFLHDAFQYLMFGTQKMKFEAMSMFEMILSSQNKFFNAEFGRKVLDQFDLISVLTDFLQLDESENILIIYDCLSCIYSCIHIYNVTGWEQGNPSPIIKAFLEDELIYESLLRLTEYNELSIQGLANLIKKEVTPFLSE